MKKGYLSQYFTGVAAKVLSPVEIDLAASNQHEFNGITHLKKIFGTEKRTFPAQFIYIDDNDDSLVKEEGILTWYDAREAHPKRTEYRMYFSNTSVTTEATAGDELFVCLKTDGNVLVIIASGDSTICNQLKWLFGIEESDKFAVRDNLSQNKDQIIFPSKSILEHLGIAIEENKETFLENLIEKFNGQFPTTKAFSEYARSTLHDLDPNGNPDLVLVSWMEREETLFRTLEEHIIAEKIIKGFDNVDDFFKFSLSAQNRRKSRAGQALENHVEQLFIINDIRYDRTKVTENKSKPDFIFPGIKEYHSPDFDISLLTMLGVKNSCKDRWRQVLSEADKIKNKHLLTLEAAISANQIKEMEFNHLQLVIPEGIHNTYLSSQRKKLITVADFLDILKFNQKAFS